MAARIAISIAPTSRADLRHSPRLIGRDAQANEVGEPATGAAAPANPTAQANLPVTATIGGKPANVQYAGLAQDLSDCCK